VLAHRAEECPGKAAVPPAADDHQLRSPGRLEQHLSRVALSNRRAEPDTAGRVNLVRDDLGERLRSDLPEIGGIHSRNRRPAVSAGDRRVVPRYDGLDRSAGELGLPHGPPQRSPRLVRSVYSDNDAPPWITLPIHGPHHQQSLLPQPSRGATEPGRGVPTRAEGPSPRPGSEVFWRVPTGADGGTDPARPQARSGLARRPPARPAGARSPD
jgi:hypothetical protein